MPTFRFDTIIQATTGLPEDYIVNSWHFSNADVPIVSDYDNVRDMLKDFWTLTSTTGGSATQAIKEFVPTSTTSNTVLVRAYQMGVTPGAPPEYSSSFTFGTRGSGTPLPSEVALCVSFQGERVDGVNQARRRNRKYLGPFQSTANGADGRPVAGLINAIVARSRELKQAADASVNWEWVGWSPTTSSNFEVVDGWVDNAWDTQRRRGKAPTARTPFTASLPAE